MRYRCLGTDACADGHPTALEAIRCSDRRGWWWTVLEVLPTGATIVRHPPTRFEPGEGAAVADCWAQAQQGIEIADFNWSHRVGLEILSRPPQRRGRG